MRYRTLTCIGCPLGCSITVTLKDQEITKITGHSCRRGTAYAEKEVKNPDRTVTTTVRVRGGTHPVVSVKTREEIPKDRIFDCIRALKEVELEAPVHTGDLVFSDAEGTGAVFIATKNVEKYQNME